MTKKTVLWGSLAALALAIAPVLLGIQQGRIVGTVTDGKGVPLEGVTVTITTPAITNFKVVLKTDKDGKWGTILNDSTIKYHYKFEKEKYVGVEQDKKVPIGTTEQLDVQLLNQQQAVEKGLVKQVEDPFTSAYNAAVDAFQAKDYDTALTKAVEATTIAPDKYQGFDLAAKIASQKKDWDKTIAFGEKTLALDADNPPMFGIVANAYRAKGDKAKAAEYEKKYAAANPDQPEILYNQAIEMINKGDCKGAEPLLKKAIEAKADYADAHYQLGMCDANLNKVAEMKKHLNEYLKLEPKGKDASTAKEMLEAFK